MTRVWRKRRALKWVGLSVSIMMLGLWVFSVVYLSTYAPPSAQWTIFLVRGRIGYVDSQRSIPGWTCNPFHSEWKFHAEMTWTRFAHIFLGFGLPDKDATGMLYGPLWLPVVAVGFPTAVLWWRDRRPKAGCCTACKYDLTGNVSGTCPECGTAVERAIKTNDASTPTDGA